MVKRITVNDKIKVQFFVGTQNKKAHMVEFGRHGSLRNCCQNDVKVQILLWANDLDISKQRYYTLDNMSKPLRIILYCILLDKKNLHQIKPNPPSILYW